MSGQPSVVDAEELRLQVVTPMFLGRVPDRHLGYPLPELRPPSIKGALRFWHRATGPAALDREAKTFGSVQGPYAGQAPFLLRLDRPGFQTAVASGGDWDKAGLRYLAYGVFPTDEQRRADIGPRTYIRERTSIYLRLVFRPHVKPEVREDVARAFRLLTLFGGLGARSRRGFGSVVLGDKAAATVAELQMQIQEELRPIMAANRGADMPRYTMFGPGTRVVVVPGGTGPLDSLARVGSALSLFRAKRGWPGDDIPGWLKQDQGLVATYARQGTIARAPNRAAFGLPHNYDNLEYDGAVARKVFFGNDFRRASPLLIHVHRVGDGGQWTYPVVLTFMPAVFFPNKKESERLVPVSAPGSPLPQRMVPPPEDFHVIDEFLDHMKNSFGAKEVEF